MAGGLEATLIGSMLGHVRFSCDVQFCVLHSSADWPLHAYDLL